MSFQCRTHGNIPGSRALILSRDVGEPDLYRDGIDVLFAPDLFETHGETHFRILDCALCLRMMVRMSRKLAITHLAQFPTQDPAWRRRRGTRRASIGTDRRSAIAQPHERAGSTALEDRGECGAVASFRRGGCPGALRSTRPARPSALRRTPPIANDLKPHPPILAASGRLAP